MFEATHSGAPTAKLSKQQRSDAADAIVAQALLDGPNAETVKPLCGVPAKQLSPAGRLDYIRAWEQVTVWARAWTRPPPPILDDD